MRRMSRAQQAAGSAQTGPPGRRTRGTLAVKKALFALLPVTCLLVALELVVRASGAADICASPLKEEIWTCDPVLYFKTNPDFHPPGETLNREGLRSAELQPERDGEFDMLFLGDSCTFGLISTPGMEFIQKPFPHRLEELLAGKRAARVINAGVPGYTSWHGLVLFETKLRHLRPDLVVVRFGWNDLFLNSQEPGSDLYQEPPSAFVRAGRKLLRRSALYRFGVRVRMEHTAPLIPERRLERVAGLGTWKPAVPLSRFEEHLERIVDIGRERGGQVWLMTSPHAFLMDEYRGRYDLFEGDLTGKGFVDLNLFGSFERLLAVHGSYMDAIRRVGKRKGAPVVDLEAVYRKNSSRHLFSDADIVHENEAGHALDAQVLVEHLARAKLDGSFRP